MQRSLMLLVIACCLLPLAGHAEIARHLDEEIEHGRQIVEASPSNEAKPQACSSGMRSSGSKRFKLC